MMGLARGFERGMLFCLATLFCACGGRVILEQGGTSGGTTGGGGAGTSGVGTSGVGTSGDYGSAVTAVAVGVTTTNTTSVGTGSTSASSGGPSPEDCGAYCKEVMNTCVGSLGQYIDEESCLNVCNSFPPGQIGDMSGNSLQCRAYHAGAAKVTMKPEVHCPHAGPTGGDLDPADSKGGPCGEGCEAFCNLALQVCPGTFQDQQDCRLECKKFGASSVPYSTMDTIGNTLSCRMYHLSVAARDDNDALIHCPHIVFFSPTCK